MMFRVAKCRVYGQPDEIALLEEHRHNSRLVRNLSLEHRTLAYRMRGATVTAWGQHGEIKELVGEYDWLKVTPQQVLQQAAARVDDAFSRFFDGQNSYPSRQAKTGFGSFTVPQRATVKRTSRRWGTVTLPGAQAAGLGQRRLKIRMHRVLPGTPTGRITYRREADGTWWACIQCQVKDRQPTKHVRDQGPVGVDLGVKVPVATSDGDLMVFSPVRPKEAERLVRLQRQLARQVKGSRNRAKTLHAIGSLKARARRRRQDYAHQVSRTLARDHSLVVFEDLNIEGMTRSAKGTIEQPGRKVAQKAGLNREILNIGWGRIIDLTVQKAKSHGTLVVKVPAAHSSQECPDCGQIDPEARVTRSRYVCTKPGCGYVGHADVGSGKVICDRGLARVSAPTRGVVSGVAEGTPVNAHPTPNNVGTNQHHAGWVETATAGAEEMGNKLKGHQTTEAKVA